jgi:histidinol-phosphate aminotransferase
MFEEMKPTHTLKKYEIAKSQSDDTINLAINENLFPVPEIVHTTFAAGAKRLFEYPYNVSCMQKLLESICKYHGASHLDPSNILVTNGSDMAFKCIFETFLTPQSKVLLASPTYPHIANFLEQLSVESVCVTCTSTLDPLKELLQKNSLPPTSHEVHWNLVYISNPNMPMGYHIASAELVALVRSCPDIIFIVDEAYGEYTEPGAKSCALHLGELKNLFVTRTFSKFFALAAIRLGYVMSNEENIQSMKPFFNDKSVLNVSLAVANVALSDESLEFYKIQLEEFFKVKTCIQSRLTKLKELMSPSDNCKTFDFNLKHGMFYLVMCDNPQELCDYLKAHKILIRNKSDEIPRAVRISIAPMAITNTVLDLLDTYFLFGLKSHS